MQEVFEKIKERLQEYIEEYSDLDENGLHSERWCAMQEALASVNQVAEEYKECTLCYFSNPCEYQNKDARMPESELNNGWIPCSERLPECEDYAETDALLFQLRSGTIEVGYFGRQNAWRDTYFRNYRNVAGVDASNVIAWQPLPEPYRGE